jgi:ribosome biogenesis GTPase
MFASRKIPENIFFEKDKLYAVDIACVGDIIEYEKNQDGTGVITEIYPRKNYISRKAPRIKGASARGQRLEQIVASNVDNLIIVSSTKSPRFNNRLIDRLIVAAESSHINPIIVINKTDLDENKDYESWTSLYTNIGYKVMKTSVIKNVGLDDLKELFLSKINLLWGQSGVGKSSLLNALYPGLELKTGLISDYSSKGKHTTVTSLMRKVEENTFIIDTPGIREIDPYGIKKEDLSHYFIEFTKVNDNCRFNTCTHFHEPGCVIVEEVSKGNISSERYQSYLNILETIEDDLFF